MKRASLLTIIALCGCAPEIPYEPAPEVVRALWNPTTGTVPTPTNLVRNETGPQLNLPLDDELPAAELEFRRYLNSLDGYPLSSTLTIPTSGPISEAALVGSFVVINADDGSSVRVQPTLAEDGLSISAAPIIDDEQDGLQMGQTYAFGLRGYEGGVRGAEGELVVADAPFYLIRTDEDLRDHPSAMPGESRSEKQEVAERLEEVRQEFLPLYDALELRGVPRDEIAVASVFTTTARPAIWFDPSRSKIPVPNGLLHDPDTDRVKLPITEEDDETATSIKTAINEYDGSATSGAVTFEATGPIDPTSLTPESLKLLRIAADGTITEEAEVERGVLDDPTHAYIRPLLRLRHSTQYVLVGTRQITTSAIPLEPQPLSALLRSSAPLYEGGTSQIGSLDDQTAEFLERWRAAAKPAIDWLETQGVPRLDMSVVVPFRTMSTVEELLAFRAELYDQNTPTTVTNLLTKTPIERGLPLILSNVETVTTGTFEIRDYLDPRTRRWRPDAPQPTLVDFVLTIPEDVAPGTPIPVVLFGHGLFTSRELVYLIANELSAAGYAMFSFDLPYHGNRSACLRDADCTGDGTCNELGQCSTELASISSPIPDGPEYPAATGSAFIEVDDIVGARDHFRQAALDMFQALRVIRSADWASATGGYVLNGDDVVYLGMSLGGILGSIVAGAEPTITDFVLNVPGGNFFQLFRDSSAFKTAFADVLEERMAPEGSDAYFELENALRWMLDVIDPINIAHHALEPYEWVDPVDGMTKQSPVKRVMIQMAQGDLVVPNSSTRSLSEAMGVPIREYTPAVSNHGFLFDPLSLEGGRARNDIVDFFEAR